jgi:hypothetical protein
MEDMIYGANTIGCMRSSRVWCQRREQQEERCAMDIVVREWMESNYTGVRVRWQTEATIRFSGVVIDEATCCFVERARPEKLEIVDCSFTTDEVRGRVVASVHRRLYWRGMGFDAAIMGPTLPCLLCNDVGAEEVAEILPAIAARAKTDAPRLPVMFEFKFTPHLSVAQQDKVVWDILEAGDRYRSTIEVVICPLSTAFWHETRVVQRHRDTLKLRALHEVFLPRNAAVPSVLRDLLRRDGDHAICARVMQMLT